jgi:hypothetical protein
VRLLDVAAAKMPYAAYHGTTGMSWSSFPPGVVGFTTLDTAVVHGMLTTPFEVDPSFSMRK